MAAAHHLAATISCHAWSGDRSMLAVCPNSAEIVIYDGVAGEPDASKWRKRWTLKEHDMLVSGLDWHPVTGLLVSVSHDRNAFVWAYDGPADAWVPQVVVLRVSKAALDVKWNAAGDAFAVSSSCKQAMVCRFEPGSNWWVSSGVKKAKSTVTAVAWHPSGDVLATASTDFRCRVLAARLPDAADGKPSPSSSSSSSAAASVQFGHPLPEFGSEMLEWEPSRAWVNDCAWSPSGRQLAFVGHDCAVHVVEFHPAGEAAPTLQTVRLDGTTSSSSSPPLPAMRLLWLSEGALVSAGHSPVPDLYVRDGSAWRYLGACEVAPARSHAPAASSSSSFDSAKAVFAGRGGGGGDAANGASSSRRGSDAGRLQHEGAVTYIQAVSTAPAAAGGAAAATGGAAVVVTAFSTSGVDGRVLVWPVSALQLPAEAAAALARATAH